jgi:hypothetical protein
MKSSLACRNRPAISATIAPMPSRRINQRIIERLESLNARQRREILALLDGLTPPAAAPETNKRAPRTRRRRTPGAVFWERLVNEGLYSNSDSPPHRSAVLLPDTE